MDSTDRTVRYKIFRFFLKHCRPPTISELGDLTALTEPRITHSLEKLQSLHHLTLYDDNVPSPTPIAMVHPFSHLPTPWVVSQSDRSWWANCAWCAFGLAAMLSPAECAVTWLSVSEGAHVIRFVDGRVANAEEGSQYHATFSAPPSKWWNDVRFACSTIQLCTSRDVAESWNSKHGFYKGETMSLETLWKLSKAWYHDKHHYEYERKTPEEKDRLFEELCMVSSYWTS